MHKPEVEIKKIEESIEPGPESTLSLERTIAAKTNFDLKIRFWKHEGHLVISFNPSVSNLKLSYKEARDLARRIVKETL